MDSQQSESRAYRVRGRVQGVGFRWWTRTAAEDLGLAGSVRNEPDGTVSVEAFGDPETLDRFEGLLREGPRFARVDELEVVRPSRDSDRRTFRIDL